MASAQPTERELDDVTLLRAQQGHAAAFRVLVELHQDAVFALIWRILGSRAQAAVVEDLAQTTFLGVYRALPRFRREGSARLSTWILAIAVRTALKERRGARPMVSLDEVDDTASSAASADRSVADRDFAAALARALDQLPLSFRTVFVLREYHGLDYGEIATALEVDLGTVKSRLSRARGELREQLKEFAP
jgi:RNA polymerase sigma-70 factor (ECF subfamily)